MVYGSDDFTFLCMNKLTVTTEDNECSVVKTCEVPVLQILQLRKQHQ